MLARGFSPVTLESHGLMSALRELTTNSSKLFHIGCRFDCPRPVLVPSNAVATHLYRIAQEAITNAVKHGRARSVVVSLSRSRSSATLAIADNGAGFPRDIRTVQGMGLRIMQYRADTIGATLTIDGANRKGRRFSVNSSSNDMEKVTVLLADDHIVVREGLRMLVEIEGDIEVVGEAKTGREAVEMTLQLHPKVVVMDIAMPMLNGLQATRQILRIAPQRGCSSCPHMPIPDTSSRSSCLAERAF